MRLLNTLYVDDHRARVSVRSKSLEVRVGRELRGRFPMAELESVVLTGAGEITSEALDRCTRAGIRVSALRRNGRLRFTVGGPTKGNVLLRVAQYRLAADESSAAELARDFAAGKLQNCRRLLRRWSWDASGITRELIVEQAEGIENNLSRLGGARDGDTIRGVEGDAARRYFKGLGAHLEQATDGFVFLQRTRRPPRDQVNALMSFLYGLVLGEVTGALETVGLDPQVGYLHGLRPGRPSLALDLVEEFRPALADRFAVSLLTRRQLRLEHFSAAAGGAWYLSDEGRQALFPLYETYRSEEVHHDVLARSVPRASLPMVQATILARRIRGDLPAYVPYLMER